MVSAESESPIDLPALPITIRSYRDSDRETCQKLWAEGLLTGKLSETDTRMDLDDIPTMYVHACGSHFWVAEDLKGEIVGMIGVQQHEAGVGEIRRLRVRSDCRRRQIGSRLVETALAFCLEQGHLKVALNTFIDRDPVLKLFEKFRFRLSRTRTVGDRDLLYFYLDLYTGEGNRK